MKILKKFQIILSLSNYLLNLVAPIMVHFKLHIILLNTSLSSGLGRTFITGGTTR